MSNLTKKAKEEILAYQGGEFITHNSSKLFTSFADAVKVIRFFRLTPARKAIEWDYDLYPNFEAYQKSSISDDGILEPNFEKHSFGGLEYSAIVWKYQQEIASILHILKQIENSDVQALVEEYKTANNLNEETAK